MAIATPPGAGALGVVRVSGPDAVVIAAALLPAPTPLATQPSHTLRRVRLVDRETGTPIDEALCAVMRAPRSYTGEDVVEISCHGGPALLAMVVERLCRAGARLAAPGEFTRRAFINGRLDLARAEAVALMIGARTERAVTLAARALAGELGARIHALHDALLDLVAGLEVALDFPDDDVGLGVEAARTRVAALARDADQLLGAAQRGRLVHDGVTIAIVGRPNAGKSSLLNALLGRDRAIVAPTPGTTRDVVDGALVIAGVRARMLDTAGLAAPGDAIEAEGMTRTRRAIEESDLLIVVVDGSVADAAPAELRTAITDRRAIVARSKADLPTHPTAPGLGDALAVSSTTGAGLAALIARLGDEVMRIVGDDGAESQLAATLRQVEALGGIAGSLHAAETALAIVPLEVALIDLRDALARAAELLGLQLGDAVLDRIFATFCVGK